MSFNSYDLTRTQHWSYLSNGGSRRWDQIHSKSSRLWATFELTDTKEACMVNVYGMLRCARRSKKPSCGQRCIILSPLLGFNQRRPVHHHLLLSYLRRRRLLRAVVMERGRRAKNSRSVGYSLWPININYKINHCIIWGEWFGVCKVCHGGRISCHDLPRLSEQLVYAGTIA